MGKCEVVFRKYDQPSIPARLSVGDIIRCSRFRWGLRNPKAELSVGWSKSCDVKYWVKHYGWQESHDSSREEAAFLVVSITLDEAIGPQDVELNNHRLGRVVECLRLTDDFILESSAERIKFYLDEPMSLIRLKEQEEIEVLGFAELPVSWEDPSERERGY